MVCNTDKNLGPAIIDRQRYAQLAWHDHLSTQDYEPLDKRRAQSKLCNAYEKFQDWMAHHNKRLNATDKRFLNESTQLLDTHGEYTFPQFYITAKVHKKTLKTRPIVSCSGSLFEGFGRWIDNQLQPIGRSTRAFINSSISLLENLKALPNIPETAHLFTCDAISMYTNINTAHCIEVLRERGIIPDYLLEGLEIIMDNNVFQFSNTYFHQLSGTAMGTPPACMWATLYFSVHEDDLLNDQIYSKYLLFYRRYIDDGFGIWNWTGTQECVEAWEDFQEEMDSFGRLRWEFSALSKSVTMLDTTLSIVNGRVESTLFEKDLNLYLYLPPHSCHSPGTLRGLIAGGLFRILKLTSNITKRKGQAQLFFNRLIARGHNTSYVYPIFMKYIKNTFQTTQRKVFRSLQMTKNLRKYQFFFTYHTIPRTRHRAKSKNFGKNT